MLVHPGRFPFALGSVRRRQGASRVRGDAGRNLLLPESLARLLPALSTARWLRQVLWFGAFMLCVAAVLHATKLLRNVPVGTVDIFGYSGDETSSRGATEEEIYLLMDEYLDQGYWDVNLVELRIALESHRWIRRASILRRWPNRLQIQIDEHLPVARWNTSHVLASSAELIPVPSNTEFNLLPQFTTPGIFSHSRDDIKLMVDQYNQLQKMLAPHFLSILELGSALGSDIWLVLEDGTRIELGEKNHLLRLQRLVDLVTSGVIDGWHNIATADLRYAHGLSVSWKKAGAAEAEPINDLGSNYLGGNGRHAALPTMAQKNMAQNMAQKNVTTGRKLPITKSFGE